MNHEPHESHESGKEADRSPTNRRKWIILLAAALLAGGLIRAVAANQEPELSYKGQSLYEWLDRYDAAYQFVLHDRYFASNSPIVQRELQESTDAVRRIGTNAVPCLLAWIENGPPLARIYDLNASERVALRRARLAVIAFELLGAEARSACPALGRMASDPQREEVAGSALDALINIGADAVPQLVSILTNTNSPGRERAAEAIGGFGTNGLPALPALLRCLGDNDNLVVGFAAVALAKLPAPCEVVLPALTNVLNDRRSMARWGVVRLLSEHSTRLDVAVPALSYALHDANPDIRWQAIVALSDLRPRPDSVLPILTNAVSDPDPRIRELSIRRLAGLSPRSESMRLLITNALNDPNPDVRRAATNAITGRDETLQSWSDWVAGQRLNSTNAFNQHFLRALTNAPPR